MLGHPETASRTCALSWLTRNEPLIQTVFGAGQEQIQQLLKLVNTEPSESFTKTGNDAAHHFSIADVMDAVRGQPKPLCWILNLPTMHSEGDNIEVAAYKVQGILRQLYPDFQRLSEWHQVGAEGPGVL